MWRLSGLWWMKFWRRVRLDAFFYLIDESDDYAQIEQWAQWINENPGPGQRLMSMAMIQLPVAAAIDPARTAQIVNFPTGTTRLAGHKICRSPKYRASRRWKLTA